MPFWSQSTKDPVIAAALGLVLAVVKQPDTTKELKCPQCGITAMHTLVVRKNPDSEGSFANCGRYFYHVRFCPFRSLLAV